MNASSLNLLTMFLTYASPVDHMMATTSFKELENRTLRASLLQSLNFVLGSNECPFSIRLYPSDAYHSIYVTSTPMAVTMAVAAIFVVIAIMFFVFDRLVEKRQSILLNKATQSNAILASIYPKNIRDRLLEDAERKGKRSGDLIAPNHRLKSFLTGGEGGPMDDPMGLQPLADLFPHT
jgi:hypothetical protein